MLQPGLRQSSKDGEEKMNSNKSGGYTSSCDGWGMCRQKEGRRGRYRNYMGEALTSLHHPTNHVILCMVQVSRMHITKGRNWGRRSNIVDGRRCVWGERRPCMTDKGGYLCLALQEKHPGHLRITWPSCPSNWTESCCVNIEQWQWDVSRGFSWLGGGEGAHRLQTQKPAGDFWLRDSGTLGESLHPSQPQFSLLWNGTIILTL